MVTLEKKLALFYKLLTQDVEAVQADEVNRLKQKYRQNLIQEKERIDEATRQAIKKLEEEAEHKYQATIGHVEADTKRQILLIQEQFGKRLLKKIRERCIAYTQTEDYLDYLRCLLDVLETIKEETVTIYITPNDYKCYKKWFVCQINSRGFREEQMRLEEGKSSMLGGIIIACPDKHMRIDFSIEAILQERQSAIRSRLFDRMGEASK